ncbi:PRC-barrel domain-containing protein [Planomonospora sp. ID67723]|uniref:PRC-barrel domain-containing protein n=1 Tax=Planomonospora sp. ID67723 TaxID=2738134 RepID=UPI0018C3E40A|nr:PRC-barrel domain-containing protein [Planomonospora sp. ID67723]MBG0829175.1 PRC-barrel domain-containing protein [Planomonospora sp. ID67723]
MITQEQIPLVINHTLYAADGDRVGEVKHVFLDDTTGRPEWLCVKTGLFGLDETFVPIRDANLVQDRVEVPYDKETIKDAPHVDLDARGHLSAEEEQELYRYYDIGGEPSWQQAGQPGGTGRSHGGGLRKYIITEERLVITKETVPAERVRLAGGQAGEGETIAEKIRKERIDVESDAGETDPGRGRRRGDR